MFADQEPVAHQNLHRIEELARCARTTPTPHRRLIDATLSASHRCLQTHKCTFASVARNGTSTPRPLSFEVAVYNATLLSLGRSVRTFSPTVCSSSKGHIERHRGRCRGVVAERWVCVDRIRMHIDVECG